MALDRALRRTILIACLALVLVASLAALLQDWWTVEASASDRNFRVFEARPFRSEAGSYLDPFDGALDGPVRTAGILFTVGMIGCASAGLLLFLPVASLPAWTPRAAVGAACLCFFAAAFVAPNTWPEEWKDYTNDRASAAGVSVDRAEWDGRWTPDEDLALVYESKPGWWFAWGAAGTALLTVVFDYVSALAAFPAAAPPPPTPAAQARSPAAPPPPRVPDFTRRY